MVACADRTRLSTEEEGNDEFFVMDTHTGEVYNVHDRIKKVTGEEGVSLSGWTMVSGQDRMLHIFRAQRISPSRPFIHIAIDTMGQLSKIEMPTGLEYTWIESIFEIERGKYCIVTRGNSFINRIFKRNTYKVLVLEEGRLKKAGSFRGRLPLLTAL